MAGRDPRYFKVYQDGDDRELEQKIQDILESGAAPGIDVQAREEIEEIQRKIDSGEIGGGGGGGGAGVDSKAREDIQKVATELTTTARKSEIPSPISSFWYSPVQPESIKIAPGPTQNFVTDYYALYDKFVRDFPNEVSKRTLGKEKSGRFDIHEYIFAPPNYEKTILVSSLTHGNEREGFRGLLRLMQHIYYDHGQYPQLVYLRTKVRIVVMPIVNPYGFSTSSRYNIDGVDLNRNADYHWYAGGATFGTGAVSEPETRIYQNWVDTYPEATLLIDFHNTEPRVGSKEYYMSVPGYTNVERNMFNQIIKTIEPEPSKPLVHQFWEPTLAGYASKKNIHGLTVEWVPGAFHQEYKSEDVQDMMNLFANSLIQLSTLNKPSFSMASTPIVKQIHGGWTDKTTASRTWAEMDFLTMEIEPQFDGIIEVYGTLNFSNPTATATNGFSLTFTQNGNRQLQDDNTQRMFTQMNTIGGNGLNTALIGAARFIKKDYTNVAGSLFVKFFWQTDAGTLSLRRGNFIIKLTPSDNVNRYEQYSSIQPGTGAVSPTPQKIYPNY